jgi:hypothetical protein
VIESLQAFKSKRTFSILWDVNRYISEKLREFSLGDGRNGGCDFVFASSERNKGDVDLKGEMVTVSQKQE